MNRQKKRAVHSLRQARIKFNHPRRAQKIWFMLLGIAVASFLSAIAFFLFVQQNEEPASSIQEERIPIKSRKNQSLD